MNLIDDINLSLLIEPVRPALDALRFFTATTRGFNQREQQKLATFLIEVGPDELRDYSKEALVEWLTTRAGYVSTLDYRHGDVAEYLQLLDAIPEHLIAATRTHAYLIAMGSGRRPISDEIRSRIELEFTPPARVNPPEPEVDD